MPSSMSPPVFQGSPRGTFYRDANYFSFLIYAEIGVFEKAYYEATLKIHSLVRPAALIPPCEKVPSKGHKTHNMGGRIATLSDILGDRTVP